MAPRLYAAVDKQLLEPLGQLTVNFGLLEFVLSFSIWILMGGFSDEGQRVGRTVTAEMSFRNLVNLYCSLFILRVEDPERREVLDGLRTRLGEAEQMRNRLLHSFWGAGAEPGTSTRLKETAKAKHGWKVEFQTMSASDITAVADEFATLAAEIQAEAFRSLGVELGSEK